MTNDDGHALLDGRYLLGPELGRGGMGVVYRATQLALDRPVAIKRLLGSFADDAVAVARFRREVLAASRLDHPGIVGVLDAGIDADGPYLVMEFVDGEPLDDVLARRGVFPEHEALAIAGQIADALAAAHAAGIVHRDVKPGNVILGPEGRARLLDFGLAVQLSAKEERVTLFGSFVGTPEYLAPEVSRGEEPDARADVYALGATLYELLTGVAPFEGSHPMATLLAHSTEPLVPPSARASHVSPAADAVVLAMLSRDALGRPANGARALALIDAAMSSHVSRVSLTLAPQPTQRVVSRARGWTPHAADVSLLPPRDLDAALLAAIAGD